MQVPPIPENEALRMASLRATGMLFTPAEERFDRITRMAARLLDMPIATVTLVADNIQWFKSIHGLAATETGREVSFCGHAIHGKDTFIVENAEHDMRFFDNPLVTGEPNIRSYAGQPLRMADGSNVGTLCVIGREPRQFTEEQIEILRDLAALVETELQRGKLSEAHAVLSEQHEELKRKASLDTLTRTWNRGAIMELLSAELARAKRGTPCCVVMVDADHFKNVNDTHGHQGGDAVLAEMASRIRAAVREFDAVGRYGGEEFIVVLSNCSLNTGGVVCERTRGFIADVPVMLPGGPLNMTASLGLAAYAPRMDSAEQLISAADSALYRAKGNGRNRVELAREGDGEHKPAD